MSWEEKKHDQNTLEGKNVKELKQSAWYINVVICVHVYIFRARKEITNLKHLEVTPVLN